MQAGVRCSDELSDLSKELGVEKHVTFAGFVEDDLKPLYYKASDIFCLPSTTMAESFGIVNLEAMAAGIPIVASNLGGIPDIVQDGVNGLLAEPGDFESLADAIRTLLVNRDMRLELGDNGRKLVNNYSWNEITQKTENLYTRVLENW